MTNQNKKVKAIMFLNADKKTLNILEMGGTMSNRLPAFIVICMALCIQAFAVPSIQYVPIGTYPGNIAVNPVSNKIYVVNHVPHANGNVSVIDGKSNLATTVPAGSVPNYIAINHITNKIYIANTGGISLPGDTVTQIDGMTNITTKIPLGKHSGIAINTITNKLYIAHGDAGYISVVDCASNSSILINSGGDPFQIAVNEKTNRIYVANYSSNSVTVIDGVTNAVSTIKLTGTDELSEIIVNAKTNKVYIRGKTITEIDGSNNSVKPIAGGNFASMAMDTITNKLYLVSATGSGTVTIIDCSTYSNTLVATGSNPGGIAINMLAHKVYVANSMSDDITVINGLTDSTYTISLGYNGKQPAKVVVNPTTSKVYVVCYSSKKVAVIDEDITAMVRPVTLHRQTSHTLGSISVFNLQGRLVREIPSKNNFSLQKTSGMFIYKYPPDALGFSELHPILK